MEGFGQRLDSVLEVFPNLNNSVRNTGTCSGSCFISSVVMAKKCGPWVQQRGILVPEQYHGHDNEEIWTIRDVSCCWVEKYVKK